ncbi:MAG: hypothetical protein GC190_03270 [Alphaproteobacteria bacterium]|nr:hypothetical protein [Alphaproteobacteria bacterium]
MVTFSLTENEVNCLSVGNAIVTAACAVGSFALGQGLQIILLVAGSTPLTPLGGAIATVGLPLCGVVTIVSFGLAAYMSGTRRNIVSVVKGETKKTGAKGP